MTKRHFIKKAIILTLGMALSVNMLAGCRGRDRLADDSVITETLEYIIPNTEDGVGAALVRTMTGETTVVYGEVTRESDGKVFVTSKDTGEKIEISETDLLPEVKKEITTTIKTSDGTSIKVEGPVVKSPDGTTTVIDKTTGSSYILEESTNSSASTKATTTRPSEPTKVTSTVKETTTTPTTTVKEPTPTTIKPTTVAETTARPTTQATTTVAPTTAPTTQATTVAPAPVTEPSEMPLPVSDWKPDFTPQQFKDELFRLINEARVNFGVNALERGPDVLWQGADIRAKELSVKFSHARPDGTANAYVYWELGYEGIAGLENIASNSSGMNAQSVFNGFMNSPGHRDTLLSQKWGQSPEDGKSKHMSIGYYFGTRQDVASPYKAVFAVVNIY